MNTGGASSDQPADDGGEHGFNLQNKGYATVLQTYRAPSGARSISLQCSPARMRAAVRNTGFSVKANGKTLEIEMAGLPMPEPDMGVITSGLCATPEDQARFDLESAGKPPGTR